MTEQGYIQSLREQNQQLQDLLADRSQEIDLLKAERAEFEGAYLDFTSKFSKLLTKGSSKKKETTNVGSTTSSKLLTLNHTNPKDNKSDNDLRIAEKDEEIQRLKEQLEKKDRQLKEFHREVDDLRAYLDENEHRGDQKEKMIKVLQCQTEELQCALAESRARMACLEKELRETASALLSTEKKLQESKAQNQSLLAQLDSTSVKLNSNYSTNHSASRDAALVQENKMLAKQLAELKSEYALLIEEMNSLKAKSSESVKNDSHEAQISSLKSQVEELKRDLDLQRNNKERSAIQNALESENKKWRCQVEDLKDMVADFECRIEALTVELKRSQEMYIEATMINDKLQSELASFKK